MRQHRPGPESRRRLLAAAALSTLLGAAGLPAWGAAPFDLTQLMQLLGRLKAGEASFTERRHVAMLEQPLVSSGTLSFEAPDSFVRETLKPRPERIAVSGNTLTIQQGDRRRTMALDAAPEAGIIVEAIRGTLTGNRTALERLFEVRVSGAAELWMLELVPRESRLRAQVSSVRVAGHQSMVREVLVSMPDGDRSVMVIEPVASTTRARTAGRPASGTP